MLAEERSKKCYHKQHPTNIKEEVERHEKSEIFF
jgi:hypothetical protein